MWIFTPHGMVSCVKHTTKHNTILVRARAKEHVLSFIGESNHDLYFHLENCDYNHRAELNEVEFRLRLLKAAANITYPDFKGSIPKDSESRPYYEACHDVWSVMNNFKRGQYDLLHKTPVWFEGQEEADAELDEVFGPRCDNE